MAFFNLTHLGSQNPVKRIPLLKEAGSDNASVESSSRKKVHEAASLIKHDDGRHEKLSSLTSLQYNNGMYNTSYQGSHKIYEELRTKHSRNLEGNASHIIFMIIIIGRSFESLPIPSSFFTKLWLVFEVWIPTMDSKRTTCTCK